jgi:hypothetical protein
VIKEVMRIRLVSPVLAPHYVSEEVEIGGYALQPQCVASAYSADWGRGATRCGQGKIAAVWGTGGEQYYA